MDPRDTCGRICRDDHYTLLHTKYESSGSKGFGTDDFFYVFPMVSLWVIIIPGMGPFLTPGFDPRGMIRLIYAKLHTFMLQTKYRSFGTSCF